MAEETAELASGERATPLARRAVEGVGQALIDFVEELGAIATMGCQVFLAIFRRPMRLALTFAQMDFLGVGSAFLVALTGLFTGMVFAKQSIGAFALFNAQSLVGPTVIISITRELAPVFTALMITMRAGSAMCTELGTMRVTEQIDALVTLAVDPLKYLVYPRVVAGTLMAPVLCMIFNAAGLFGTWFVTIVVEGLSPGTFLSKVGQWVEMGDLMEGLVKSAIFGLIVTLIACFKGYRAAGGAKGVGKATTEAMVLSAVAIFMMDYLMAVLLIRLRGGV